MYSILNTQIFYSHISFIVVSTTCVIQRIGSANPYFPIVIILPFQYLGLK
jgi:hypothetical protein